MNDCQKRIKELEEEVERFKSATTQWELIQNLLEVTNRKLFETEKKLKDALIRAEEGTRAKSIFLANMSHEIRTPLNGIIGMVEILENTPLSDDQKEYLNIIMVSSESLMQIINDILDFSKIEAGKIDLEYIEFDLRNIIFNVANILIPHINKKNLEVITYIDPHIPGCLMGDPVRLQQVILNLVNNAIKFTDRGEVYIGADMIYKKDDQIKIRVEVVDTGIGISKKNQRKIFSSFSQADSSTTRKYGGTGLGLSIAKRLIEQMNGDIGLDSEPGVGSNFHFNITLDICDFSNVTEINDIDRNARVLVVDDNQKTLKVLGKYLDFLGYQHALVADPDRLISVLYDVKKEPSQQIVLLDYNVAGKDSVDLVRQWRKENQFNGNVKFVLMIPLGLMDVRDKELKEIFDNIITKPVKLSVLQNALLVLTGKGEVSEPEIEETRFGKFDKRILVVDDNEINLKVAKVVLADLFEEIDVASNGKEAVTKHRANKYDIIFMDLLMPEMDGIDATKAIREDDQDVIIVAVSANSIKDGIDEYLKAGMNDFVTKPYKSDKIKEVMERFFKL